MRRRTVHVGLARLSQKYLGEDPPPEPDDVVRLIVSVTAETITEFSP